MLFVTVLPCLALLAPPDAAEIDRLVRQLGSPRFAQREAAAKGLEAVGEGALDALRKAAGGSKDPEVRRRAGLLVEAIESRDYQRIEGSWEGTSDRSLRLHVLRGRVVFTRGTQTSLGFVLGPTRTPKTIDFKAPRGGVVLRGIYSLKGDDLAICLPVRDDLKRPAQFAAEGNADCVTLTFKRAAP